MSINLWSPDFFQSNFPSQHSCQTQWFCWHNFKSYGNVIRMCPFFLLYSFLTLFLYCCTIYLHHSWLTDTDAHNHLAHSKFVILQERMLQNNVHKCVSICTLGCWFFYSLLAVWRCFPPNASFLNLVTMKTIWINFKHHYYIWWSFIFFSKFMIIRRMALIFIF